MIPVRDRVARHRRRVRLGLQVIPVVIPAPMVEALIIGGMLTDDEARDAAAVGRAIVRVVEATLKVQ